MTDALSHRGPDGEGQWLSENDNIGLGHRRLSIIDLTNAGKQPMHYLERYTIVFNGAIYNYPELKELCIAKGYRFVSKSDTEVILAMYDWKKEDCLSTFDGMFSFALYDKVEKKLFIARDRFGEKPFYFHFEDGKKILFASEMKSLWAAGIERDINQRMLYNYMAFNYTHNIDDEGETFFQNIRNLPPAHYIYLDVRSLQCDIRKYWEIDHGKISDFTFERAKQKFQELFYSSVTRRLRSDVTTGTSLSGGIDSSAVLAAIDQIDKDHQHSSFSAVYPGYEKDESSFINTMVNKIKVDAHFVSLNEKDLLDDIEKCFYHQEEPFGSASVLSQYEVMKLAKENKVKVLLDGQGADEILAGYHHFYNVFFREMKKLNRKKYAEEKISYTEMYRHSKINPPTAKDLRYYARNTAAKDKLKKLKETWGHLTSRYFTNEFFNEFKNRQLNTNSIPGSLNEALFQSTKYELPQLLHYADRNSMAYGRELRLPFLSHELTEFLFSLPADYKIKNGWTKYLERSAFEGVLPETIVWRKDKIGYEPPQEKWLQSASVKDLVLSSRKRLIEEKILDPHILKKPIDAGPANVGTKTSWNQIMAACMFSR